MKEIGSKFWTIDYSDNNNGLDYLNIGSDYKLMMSGRTAIDYIIGDIDNQDKVVYMPDYCCLSMVQPFIDNGYKVEYYKCDILNKKYGINTKFDCGVFFAMSYFGYNESNMDNYIEAFKERGITVIEDITHRLLSTNNHSKSSTYLVASLQKWFPVVSGGVAIKMNGKFKNSIDDYKVFEEYVATKKEAMDLKRKHIDGNYDDKTKYLGLFSQADQMIEEDYRGKKIDDDSLNVLKNIDIDEIKRIRVENCLAIEKLLKNNEKIVMLFKFEEGDCPLFVPIKIDNRDKVRERLISDSIYLPMHWPNDLKLDNEIYNYELSLVCDQRYKVNDVSSYVSKLISIVEDGNDGI